MRRKPEHTVLETDLCDHWLDLVDHRCQNYWRVEFDLIDWATVRGHTMFGQYRPGVWRFCRMHAKIFERDRRPLP